MINSPPRVGILGGGQLAQMLCLAGAPLGLEMHVLSPHPTDPAAQVTGFWQKGDPSNPRDLKSFAKQVDLLTFESEFFPASLLRQGLSHAKLQIFPSLSCLESLQDRALQKNLLLTHKLATADFMLIRSKQDLLLAFKKFHNGFVLKKRTNGYDGNGTFYCHSRQDLAKLEQLLPQNEVANLGFIAEEHVSFRRECALILLRTNKGQFLSLPLVETKQKDSRCDWVVGPEKHADLKKVTRKLQNLLKKIDYVGALGVELFDTGHKLLINELAPRVHNSGHYSQTALNFDQFQLHLLCGLGHDLPKIQSLSRAFAMVNLIGGANLDVAFTSGFNKHQSELHWYGKTQSRSGRKLGHLNLLGDNKQSLLKILLKERRTFKL